MKYCLNSRLSPKYLAQADEIKIDFRDRHSIPDLIEKYPEKTLILLPPIPYYNNAYDWKEISAWSLGTKGNFILSCARLQDASIAKERGIKFMLAVEANTYWDLKGMMELGAYAAYIGTPLFFNLKATKNFSIKLRIIPTIALNTALPHSSGIHGQWIRPEDVSLYEDYIDTFEFDSKDRKREQTLFDIYSKDQKWSTRLDILVEDLGSSAINRMIDPKVAKARLNCRQKCEEDGSCHICDNSLRLANPELIKKIYIEK